MNQDIKNLQEAVRYLAGLFEWSAVPNLTDRIDKILSQEAPEEEKPQVVWGEPLRPTLEEKIKAIEESEEHPLTLKTITEAINQLYSQLK